MLLELIGTELDPGDECEEEVAGPIILDVVDVCPCFSVRQAAVLGPESSPIKAVRPCRDQDVPDAVSWLNKSQTVVSSLRRTDKFPECQSSRFIFVTVAASL